VKPQRVLLGLVVIGLLVALVFSGCATKSESVVEEEPKEEETVKTDEVAEEPDEIAAEEEPVEEAAREESEGPEPMATVVMRDSDGDGVPDDKDRCPDTPAGLRVDAFGCPKSVGGVMEIQLTIEFDFDSAEIREAYLSERYKIDNFMASNPEAELIEVVLDGHTCDIGTKRYNYDLSRRRAEKVRDVLMNEIGVGTQYFRINAYGEDRPYTSNNTVEGRRKNRRVDVIFRVKNVK
jgi:OOP family OmpA-OmpF porin